VTEPTEGWLEREGISLHYLEWRPANQRELEPPLLLLHGLSSNARYWERLARHVGRRRLVALDQRGHGLTGRPPRSPAVPAGYAMDELLGDASYLIDALKLPRPLVVGHSWGATVALELVGRHPGLASGLVFIDGPVQSAANLFSWEEAQQIMQPPLPRFASFADAVSESRADFGDAWADDLEPFVRARVVPDGDALVLTLTSAARLELLRDLYGSQPDILWPGLEVPASVLLARRGSQNTRGWKEQGAAKLASAAPQVRIRWFDTPHDIPIHAPADVAEEIEHLSAPEAGPDSSEAAAR
jgi:pimeloyl-ACP methyl ester carboxylesterase